MFAGWGADVCRSLQLFLIWHRMAAMLSLGHDDVIQCSHIHQGEGVFQSLRDALIRLAGLGNSAWIVMGEDSHRRVMAHGGFDHLARMHACSVDGAPEKFFEGNYPVPVINPEHGEDFMFELAEAEL